MFAKHKNKIIAVVVVAAVLTGAWFFGGNYSKDQESGDGDQEQRAESAQDLGTRIQDLEETGDARDQGSGDSGDVGAASEPVALPGADEAANVTETTQEPTSDSDADSDTSDSPGESEPNDSSAAETPPESGDTATEDPAPAVQTQDNSASVPTPEENPPPVEPEDASIGDGSFTVTLSVRCDTILSNMNLLNKEKWELVPADGVIFAVTAVTAYEGESVFNLVLREMKQARIHFTFRNTPIYNSAYIEAFNNLYEFDTGELSGWMYSVNGWYPNYGCSRYQLEPGDVIAWNYTCDLGRDLGQAIGGWQLDD